MPVLEFSLGSTAADKADTPCVVAGVFDGAFSPAAAAIDAASGGALARLREIEVRDRDADCRGRTCALAIDHACFRYTATLRTPNGGAPRLTKLELMVDADARRGLDEARALARGVAFARELGCLPPNLCTPAHIAAQARAIADEHAGSVTLEVLEREDMQKLGMGALLRCRRVPRHRPS